MYNHKTHLEQQKGSQNFMSPKPIAQSTKLPSAFVPTDKDSSSSIASKSASNHSYTTIERPRASSLPVHRSILSTSTDNDNTSPHVINFSGTASSNLSFRHRRYRAQTAAFTSRPSTITGHPEPVATETNLDNYGNVKPITSNDDNATQEWKKVLIGLVAVGPSLLNSTCSELLFRSHCGFNDSGDAEEVLSGMAASSSQTGFIDKLRVWPQARVGMGRGQALRGNIMSNAPQMGHWQYSSRPTRMVAVKNGSPLANGEAVQNGGFTQRSQDAQATADVNTKPAPAEISDSVQPRKMHTRSFSPHAPTFVPSNTTLRDSTAVSNSTPTTTTATPTPLQRKKTVPVNASQLPREQPRRRSQSSASNASAKSESRYSFRIPPLHFGAIQATRSTALPGKVTNTDVGSSGVQQSQPDSSNGNQVTAETFASVITRFPTPFKPTEKKDTSDISIQNTQTNHVKSASISDVTFPPLVDQRFPQIKPLVWSHTYSTVPLPPRNPLNEGQSIGSSLYRQEEMNQNWTTPVTGAEDIHALANQNPNKNTLGKDISNSSGGTVTSTASYSATSFFSQALPTFTTSSTDNSHVSGLIPAPTAPIQTNPSRPGHFHEWTAQMHTRALLRHKFPLESFRYHFAPWPTFSNEWVEERWRLVEERRGEGMDLGEVLKRKRDAMEMNGVMDGLVVREDGLWGFGNRGERGEGIGGL